MHGLDVLRRVLDDLAVGMPIAESLERYVGPTNQVDRDFAAYARARAEELAPNLAWERDVVPPKATAADLRQLQKTHPNNYWLQRSLGQKLVLAKQWESG